jgi:hypothetical protein
MLSFYGCIVDIGVADGDAIGDELGYGCAAVAPSVVAVATNAPARMIPTNHRVIELLSSLWFQECLHAASTQAGIGSNSFSLLVSTGA